MVEETAEETVQRVNAKRLAANRASKKRKYIKIDNIKISCKFPCFVFVRICVCFVRI